jgi:DNA topoisomerase-2
MDGLKVSQRKILYSAFKKNLTSEIKVAQFSGYVSENSGYHHGEASLNGAIVNMAQDFVGSNNINLFSPNGQFGTRLQGGKDSASERYIFTKLEKITRLIFNKSDDQILSYLQDDGQPVEPIFYVPIIPMILVNGSKGIGTGFSTEIQCFNPKDLTQYILNVLEDKPTCKEFVPYYRGFRGSIVRETESRFITKGVYSIKKNIVEITELPVGTWNEDYLIYLDKLVEEGIIKDFNDMSTDKVVNFKITLAKDFNEDEIVKTLRLYSYLSFSNMNLFNHEEKLVHYNKIHEICDDFIEQRLKYYGMRKEYLLAILVKEIEILKNKYNYIQEILEETLDLRKKSTTDICAILSEKGYSKIEGSYHYLIKMSMDSVCEENVKHLRIQYTDKETEYKEIERVTIQELWSKELRELEKIL